MKLISVVSQSKLFFVLLFAMLCPFPVVASTSDAIAFISYATGRSMSSSDPIVVSVGRQLDEIAYRCSASGLSAGVHDMLAKGHSMLSVQQPLLEITSDFVRVANAQCSKVPLSALVTIYVLERNAGSSHFSAIDRISKNPSALIRKWDR